MQNALAAIGTGGYPEAIALMGALIGRGAGRIPLARLEMIDRFVRSDEMLSTLSRDEVRRIKAEQAVVAELEPERGLQSLPKLLADAKDRRRAIEVLDEAVAAVELTAEQRKASIASAPFSPRKPPASRRGKHEAAERELAATV